MSPHTFSKPAPGAPRQIETPLHVVVAGGGIAGIAAATVLSERGARVTLVEREPVLGGRASAWTDHLADGTGFQMERGFHAFFRQYYNLRSLLRRVDPELSQLVRLDDYPVLGAGGQAQSFAGLPRRTPWNIATLTWRTPALGFRDLRHVNVGRAIQMLAYDSESSYARWDDMSAAEYLDSLNFPPDARRLLFDVFAHSFFNPEEEMSAGELLMMFHFYFTGNPEGLVFDVLDKPFSTGLWEPFQRLLQSRGVEVRLGESVSRLHRAGDAWVATIGEDRVQCDASVLALNVAGLKTLVDASPELGTPYWRDGIASLDLTHPFAVWRLWLDRPTPGRAPFVGTTGAGLLDNISLYHLFEDESAEWARRTGGSVVELHAYAVPPDTPEQELRSDLLAGLHALYPETREASIVEDRFFIRQDCPAFRCGSDARRPGVVTPMDEITLAGDFVKLPFPSALMERAAASGFMAANQILGTRGIAAETIHTVRPRGMLAGVAS